jgi:hypothetical protein
VDFELRETGVIPGHAWWRHHPEPDFDMARLEVEAESHNNMIQAMSYRLEVVK